MVATPACALAGDVAPALTTCGRGGRGAQYGKGGGGCGGGESCYGHACSLRVR